MNVASQLPYFPRPQLLEAILVALDLGRAVTLFAPRRQGKTMFVTNELIPAAETRRWQVAYVDLWLRRSQPELAMVEGLEAAAAGTKNWLTQPLRLTKVTAKGKFPAVEVGMEAAPTQREPDEVLANRLAAAFGALVKRSPMTLLVFDEFQALAAAQSEDFVATLRTLLQRHAKSIKVFYTGSSRAALNNMFNRQRAPLFRSATSIALPDLGEDFCKERAAVLRTRGLRVSAKAIVALFERLFHTPEFLNEVIVRMVIAHNQDASKGFDDWYATDLEENTIRPMLDDLRPIHKAVLNVLAQQPQPAIFAADTIKAIGSMTPDGTTNRGRIQTALNTLTNRGLVAPTGSKGGYEIEDRALLVYLHEHEPRA